ncbi:MAG: gamma-glutamyl-gamma-aminobutyrate hydrolase family protein [Deinococcaceae bacterium]
MLKRPKIGLSVSRINDPTFERWIHGTSVGYSASVLDAGGLPVMLPNLPGTAEEHVSHIDGLVLTGGADVAPWHYGKEPRRGLGELDTSRDEFEMALYRAARTRGIPILGICRGMQYINVLEGGTLYQHLPDFGFWVDHSPKSPPPTLSHTVQLDPASTLGQAYGTEHVRVNSHHHQGIEHLAPNLSAVGHAPDGLIEAFEAPGLLGVQWHPELIFEQDPFQRAPFDLFIRTLVKQS